MNIAEANILITGGSLGLGKAMAKLLVQSGAQVAITGRDKERIEAAASECDTYPIVADVSSTEDVKRTLQEFLEKFGQLNCLINNAGIGGGGQLIDLDPSVMERVWRVNVLGATLMAQAAARQFISQGSGGDIVNIASTASLRGYRGGSAYSSSKFALRSLSECWRAELRQHNIRVIHINPSEVPTAFGSEERVERPLEASKLTPLEIAHAVKATLEMDSRGFIPELSVFATNP